MIYAEKIVSAVALAGLIMAIPGAALAGGKHKNMACADLANWVKNDDHKVLSATSEIVPESGGTPSYCVVNLKRHHAVNIRVGLPLNKEDGGTGGVNGAWNGKIENLGGGGFVGSVGSVTGPVAAGYVGSATDTGHSRDWCNEINPDTGEPNSLPNCGAGGASFVLDPDYNLYKFQVKDFLRDSMHQQVLKAIDLSKAYYGKKHKRNYWNSCSTGGRQGMQMAQTYGELFDGILAGAPAMNYGRFQVGELWVAVVINELLGPGGLSNTKFNAASDAAIAACDANDGVADGLVNEPRRCDYDARERLCSAIPGDANCLTDAEAEAINKIWEGPLDSKGRHLWAGLPVGTSISLAASGSLMGSYVSQWVKQDPDWDLATVGIDDYEALFTESNNKIPRALATDNPDLDNFEKHGGKMIHYHGLTDPLIFTVGSWEYSSRVMERYGVKKSHKFMRSFFYPGNGHCGGGSSGTPLINSDDMFDALVNWVEHGVKPDYIVASDSSGNRTAKICMYPDETVYNGSGDVNDEANYHCAVNKKEPEDLKEWVSFAPRKGDRGNDDHGNNHGNDNHHNPLVKVVLVISWLLHLLF